MAVASLVFAGAFGLLAVGVRAWIHTRRTGRSPFRGGAGVAGVVAVLGNAAAIVAGPVLDVVTGRGRLVHGPLWVGLGLLLAASGLAGTVWAQLAMGDAWRIGVDPGERTRLVVAGPFRWVRNPIYTSMMLFAAGLALMVTNVASLAGLAFVIVALELHVRHVEEPYLAAAFAQEYRGYSQEVGRFLPGVGRLAA
jgi:protein-S-isoprenylcysteine O-methyltransferase Ste14